jgi:hypothetical protein
MVQAELQATVVHLVLQVKQEQAEQVGIQELLEQAATPVQVELQE